MHGLLCTDEATIGITTEAVYLRALAVAYDITLRTWNAHTHDYFDTREAYRDFHLSVIQRFLSHVQARFGTGKRIVLKEPTLAEYFPILASLLVDCLFILMIRDPRDALASQITRRLRKNPNKRPSVADLLSDYVNRYRPVLAARTALGARLKIVHYEDMVTQPRAVLSELRTFTGLRLPIDPLAEGWATKRDPTTNESWSALDGQPISAASIGKFQSVLTKGEQKYIERHRSLFGEQFGFEVFRADSHAGSSPSV